MSSFFTCCYKRFETLAPNEIEAKTSSILPKLDFNTKTGEYERMKLETAEYREERVNFNRLIKRRLSAMKKAIKDELLSKVENS